MPLPKSEFVATLACAYSLDDGAMQDAVSEKTACWLNNMANAWSMYASSDNAIVCAFVACRPMRLDNVHLSLQRALRLRDFDLSAISVQVRPVPYVCTTAQLDDDDAHVMIQQRVADSGIARDDTKDALRERVDILMEQVASMAVSMAAMTATLQPNHSPGTAASSTTNTTNSNNTTNINSNNNVTYIMINDFGKENATYLQSPEELMKLRSKGVMRAIHQIHFNDEHVENQNVRLKSLKKSMVEVVQDGHWTPRCMTSVTDEMIKSAFGVITRRYVMDESFREEMDAANGDGLLEWYMRMMSMGPEKHTVMNPLRRDLEALLVAKKPAPEGRQRAVAPSSSIP